MGRWLTGWVSLENLRGWSPPRAYTVDSEAQEKQELAAELESLRQAMLHPAAVLVEAEKGREIRRTKGNP